MVSLRRNLRQRVLWKRWTSSDRYDAPSYSAAEEIPARVEEKARLGVSGPGTGVLATTNIVVEHDVRLGDLVATDLDTLDPATGEPYFEEVEARESYVDRSGAVLGYKCYLEPVQRS